MSEDTTQVAEQQRRAAPLSPTDETVALEIGRAILSAQRTAAAIIADAERQAGARQTTEAKAPQPVVPPVGADPDRSPTAAVGDIAHVAGQREVLGPDAIALVDLERERAERQRVEQEAREMLERERAERERIEREARAAIEREREERARAEQVAQSARRDEAERERRERSLAARQQADRKALAAEVDALEAMMSGSQEKLTRLLSQISTSIGALPRRAEELQNGELPTPRHEAGSEVFSAQPSLSEPVDATALAADLGADEAEAPVGDERPFEAGNLTADNETVDTAPDDGVVAGSAVVPPFVEAAAPPGEDVGPASSEPVPGLEGEGRLVPGGALSAAPAQAETHSVEARPVRAEGTTGPVTSYAPETTSPPPATQWLPPVVEQAADGPSTAGPDRWPAPTAHAVAEAAPAADPLPIDLTDNGDDDGAVKSSPQVVAVPAGPYESVSAARASDSDGSPLLTTQDEPSPMTRQPLFDGEPKPSAEASVSGEATRSGTEGVQVLADESARTQLLNEDQPIPAWPAPADRTEPAGTEPASRAVRASRQVDRAWIVNGVAVGVVIVILVIALLLINVI